MHPNFASGKVSVLLLIAQLLLIEKVTGVLFLVGSKMDRGTKLTAEQQAAVKAIHRKDHIVREIANVIKRPPTAVQNFINRFKNNL